MNEKKIIVITNDDGINSLGLKVLYETFSSIADVWVVAPCKDKSGSSHCLTMDKPLQITELSTASNLHLFSLDGNPSDCVYIAISCLLKKRKVALVLSGINKGFNIADDISYSGTLGAALESALLDVPSIAFSIDSFDKNNLNLAARFAKEIVLNVLNFPQLIPNGVYININLPAKTKYFKITSVGRRKYSKQVKIVRNPKGSNYYWIGGVPLQYLDIKGSDCNAVFAENAISVTPLSVNQSSLLDLIDIWRNLELDSFKQLL